MKRGVAVPDQVDLTKNTHEELFTAREQPKTERSRGLARLPVAKKLEIAEKFRDILDEALREDDEQRAAERSTA
jgi:hypothetical protein